MTHHIIVAKAYIVAKPHCLVSAVAYHDHEGVLKEYEYLLKMLKLNAESYRTYLVGVNIIVIPHMVPGHNED